MTTQPVVVTTNFVRVCPSCRSRDLGYDTMDKLAFGLLTCQSCGFEGSTDEFLLFPPHPGSVEVRIAQPEGAPDIIYMKQYAGLTPRGAFQRVADEESLVIMQMEPFEVNDLPIGIDAVAVLEHGDVFRISGVVCKLR